MAKFLFNFKKQFAAAVRNGTKLQTIRATRADKRRPTPGDIACLYTGLRTSKTELLREATITGCNSILMDLQTGDIVVDGQLLTRDDATELAEADGFAGRREMLTWFTDQHGAGIFRGFITKWAPLIEMTP